MDSVHVDVGDTYLESIGRIIQLDLTVKSVCPGKKVALAVILTEVDAYGDKHQRGLKPFTVPAHDYAGCRDIDVKYVKFVLPEDLNVSGGTFYAMCDRRNLKVRVIADYIDTGFRCCDAIVTL